MKNSIYPRIGVISCNLLLQKEAEAEQLQTESNVMLEEPKTTQESAVAGTPEEEGKTGRRSRLLVLS